MFLSNRCLPEYSLTAFIALSLFLCLNLLSCSVADCKKLIGDNNLGGLACEEEEDKHLTVLQ